MDNHDQIKITLKDRETSVSHGEWSLRSSSRNLLNSRSERKLSVVLNKDDVTDKITADSSSHVDPKLRNLCDSHKIDDEQADVLKDFFFDSLSQSPVSARSSEGGSSIFETTFDLTEDRLRRLFNLFDADNDGTISYEELKLGFAYHDGTGFGMSKLDDRAFLGLIQYLDADKSGEISFEEFSEGIRLLMLRTILQQVARSERNKYSVLTEVFDYNSVSLEQYLLKGIGHAKEAKTPFAVPTKSLMDFFLHERGDGVSVRWINITGKNASNIMRMMALKYRLHPLALEDALECADHRPKADSYHGHYFIIIPVFYLKEVENSEKVPDVQKQMKRTWYNRLFYTHKNNTHENSYETATEDETTIDTDDYAENKFIGVHMTSIFITRPSGKTVITYNNEHNEDFNNEQSEFFNNEQNKERCWCKLQGKLEKDYSKLRQYDGQYLAHSLIDRAVDKIGEIVKKLSPVVKKEKKFLRDHGYRNLDRIHLLKQELKSMNRQFKPFLRLLVHIIEDDSFSPGASIYLRDVLDNLEMHEDDTKNLIAKCDSADVEAENLHSKQMDSTLYVLTAISAIFLPAQFLTGVWGMNFDYMPELHHQFGYYMFWVISLSMAGISICLLKFMGHSN